MHDLKLIHKSLSKLASAYAMVKDLIQNPSRKEYDDILFDISKEIEKGMNALKDFLQEIEKS